MRIEPQRVAPDDMPDRLAPSRQAAPFEREHNNRDMFIEPALRQEDADNECLDERAEHTAAAQPLDPGADRRRHADQHDDRDNAALAPNPVAAARAVELAVEERDRVAGEHDRVRHMREHCRQIAEQRIDRETDQQQQQHIVVAQRYHRIGNLGYAAAVSNRQRVGE